MSEAELFAALVAAHKDGASLANAADFASIDRATAYRIQQSVREQLGRTIGMLKTAIQSDQTGVAAPIYADRIWKNGAAIPADQIIGIEVEVGIVLARDVDASTGIASAIDHYFTGVELISSRYQDRTAATPNAGLADNMTGYGYVVGPKPRSLQDKIDEINITIAVDGQEIYSAPARHGFGSILASLTAYAKNQHPDMPLKAGTMITTGSMCGLVPLTNPGHIVTRLGDDETSFELTSD